MCTDWSLSIDLKLSNQSTTKWSNILSLQAKGSASMTADFHIPAVWIRPNQKNVMLMVAYNLDTNPHYAFNITTRFNTGNWINLQMTQINGVFEIKVDYKKVYSIANSMPKKWRNVDLVTGNTNGTRYVLPIGYYRNFDIITCVRRKTMKYCIFYF